MAGEATKPPPGRAPDDLDPARAEGEKVGARIDAAFEKLARKMRARADKAHGKLDAATPAEKRAVLLRRYELYADAAAYLEERLVQRGERST
ncbi:hypothetical protein MCBMB27_04299 [Methylobacterium phyllosphaerae]|jgi:hypothetical protein|uniref:Uncharacterized protein n=1 Tax=Methylobacterium phyllosphaerae TaxID=418223 RepID=A0AAE8HQI7_9HYPH|nr:MULTISPECIES: hypothetical protein [Methylobacterium]APT33590.1 hypothetical protein MCBMB27_04299 [Methylobacterium phyllosphaerae]AWV15398.1 hypothetical protein A3862_07610 [Methylobacterium sp. XJLW]SFG71355.1 hypothetical protein SAMN05192567_10719 [Methylobacterium phyllosphaerae]